MNNIPILKKCESNVSLGFISLNLYYLLQSLSFLKNKRRYQVLIILFGIFSLLIKLSKSLETVLEGF